MKLSCGDTFLFRGVKLKRASLELLSQNTVRPETRRQLLEMAQEDQSETSQQTATSDEEKGPAKQASPSVIEIHDSTTECEEEARPGQVQMEEKAFVSRLHSFMKDKVNLWGIYKAVDKLGGYDSVTARRLWKKVYDELGGSPGSTSAATCTRRHYERLVLPFERHIKGEDDKPLPPSKPRKPYKRNLDGKVSKAEGKRKRTHSERDIDPELLTQRSPEAACQSEVMHSHSALWAATSDRHHPDCSQPNRSTADLCTYLLPVTTSRSWITAIPPAAGEVISPLEKKKRMAQASLNLPKSPQGDDKERPSVIHCSQSPARASSSRNCNSSDGSPLPLSSSSSRSPSPCSVSSEDGAAGTADKPASSSKLPQNCSSAVKNAPNCSEDSKPVNSSQTPKDPTGQNKDVSHISSQTLTADSTKSQVKDSAWKPYHKETGRYYTPPIPPYSNIPVKPTWAPTSTSSFTKVYPKSVQLLRPAPIRPSYKVHHSRLLQQDDSLACGKKLNVTPWPYQTEKREKSRTMLQKAPPAQQSLSHSTTTLPVSFVLPSCDKTGRDSRHQPPLHPAFLPNRMRLPQSQLMYRHVLPMGPAHPALIGPAVYPYPYTIPLLNPQTGYALPAMNPIYSHKL
ncbi:AT-rich interactive domain-containing protein 5A isoform X2 [Mugil cephalus]|uniref:AT-rich interactive domain-containing protein 5A isoform X2 n=1 Tax=Mugil cephalus TaxID=48193 RepID=UPI001FB57981|nr:AT-rich interactive domain-containing protein 5A isoform X2 [Mugil cephalus]